MQRLSEEADELRQELRRAHETAARAEAERVKAEAEAEAKAAEAAEAADAAAAALDAMMGDAHGSQHGDDEHADGGGRIGSGGGGAGSGDAGRIGAAEHVELLERCQELVDRVDELEREAAAKDVSMSVLREEVAALEAQNRLNFSLDADERDGGGRVGGCYVGGYIGGRARGEQGLMLMAFYTRTDVLDCLVVQLC